MKANGCARSATAAISAGGRPPWGGQASPRALTSSRPFPFCILRFFLLPLLLAAAPANTAPIPMDQIGAVAGKQYQGDGLSVAATPEGVRLRCVFQKLEGEATPQGLWLTSTTDTDNGQRFRVVAVEVGFLTPCAPSIPLPSRSPVGAHGVTRPAAPLPRAGTVSVAGQLARFTRPGLTEEYSVSMDGIRQDFLIERPPLNPQPSTLNPQPSTSCDWNWK
jgi:hypothetical protein